MSTIMTSREIADYVFNWWQHRFTLDGNELYRPESYMLDSGNIVVDVHTPWHTVHQSIILFKDWKYAEYQWNQYHYSGILPCSELNKKRLYNMLLKQQIYNESYISENYWEVKAELKKSHLDPDVFSCWCNYQCEEPTVEAITKCEEEYVGDYDSDADFAESWFLDTETSEIKDHVLFNYIDWDRVYNGEFNYNGIFSDNGHYFDSNRS